MRQLKLLFTALLSFLMLTSCSKDEENAGNATPIQINRGKLIVNGVEKPVNKAFIIDNSRYESLGKIEWQNISKIERIKKKSIEIFVNESVFKNRKLNLIKKFLMFMGNWNYKKSIIISSALLDCSIEELYENITKSYKSYKKTTHNSGLAQ